jgi:hypothetical protein
MDKTKDHLERRCPRLGGAVTFKYCRISGDQDLPCWKIFDCWWEYFDIMDYLRQNMPGKSFLRLVQTKPKSKISSLVELIEQAKNRVG